MELAQVGLSHEPDFPQDDESELMLHASMKGHSRAITALFFNDGGKQLQLVSTSLDRTFRIWNASTGEQEVSLTDSAPIGACCRLPSSSDIYVTANSKAIVKLINADPFREDSLYQKIKMENEVRAMTFDEDGNYVILGTKMGNLSALNIEETTSLDGYSQLQLKFSVQKFSVSDSTLTDMTFIPESSHACAGLIVNSMDDTVVILDCKTDQTNRLKYFAIRRRVRVAHTLLPLGSCYSSSGDGFVISASEDNKAYVYSLGDYRLQQLSQHDNPVMKVAVNQGNTLLATGDTEGFICLWRQNTVDED